MAYPLAYKDAHDISQSGHSRRRFQRIATIRRFARLTNGSAQGLARINNISDGGLCLTVPARLPIKSVLTIHLAEDVSVTGRVAWSRGNDCGVLLDHPIDCRSVLSAATQSNCRSKDRGLTLHVDGRIRVIWHDQATTGRLRELTPHSCKIQGVAALQRGSPLKLVFATGAIRRAFVRGLEDDGASVLFCEALEVPDVGLFPLPQAEDLDRCA